MTGFVGVDWGSSRLRAYRIAEDTVLGRRESDEGILSIEDGNFAPVLDRLLDGWPETRVLLSGMITSRSGWRETGYADCPAGLDGIVAGQIHETVGGRDLHFLPGVAQGADGRAADVMRGEEVQILGLPDDRAPRLVVLPGTHSKWASVEAGTITGFRTFMTGEIFDLVRNHSLAGRVAEGSADDPAAFARGVAQGAEGGTPIADLFSVRPAVLRGTLPPAAVDAFLSGLLIGNEIREAGAILGTGGGAATILGTPALARRYAAALDLLGRPSRLAPTDAAPVAFARIEARL